MLVQTRALMHSGAVGRRCWWPHVHGVQHARPAGRRTRRRRRRLWRAEAQERNFQKSNAQLIVAGGAVINICASELYLYFPVSRLCRLWCHSAQNCAEDRMEGSV